MKIVALTIHPLKSGRAIACDSVRLLHDGFENDRRYMLVDPDGAAVTQRELQAIARIEATVKGDRLALAMEGRSLETGFDPERRAGVEIWGTKVDAAVADDDVNATLSAWLGQPLRLVHMDARSVRVEGDEWAGESAPVGFADGFPVLVTTTGSLVDLNATLVASGEPPVGIDRFRTNIHIDCDEPWAEDRWESIEIGGIVLDLVKPCARCIMTTQDQMTGERIGGNPLQALAVKRMSADRRVPGVLFGWNAVARGEGTLSVGQLVTPTVVPENRWPLKLRG